MIRDWHASYLSDRVVMAAAQRHANTTGDDGYATAATLALTLSPAITSLQAIGARAILAPGADALHETEEAYLHGASSLGYYNNPGIGYDNHDMAPSMTRRALPGEKIRPDLICPACCRRRGQPEESGVQRQVYRCTESDCPAPLWEYVPPTDGDCYETDYGFDDPADEFYAPVGMILISSGGQVTPLATGAWIDEAFVNTHIPLPPASCPRCGPDDARTATPDVAHRCPRCSRAWAYSPGASGGPALDPSESGVSWQPVTDAQHRANAMARLASVMGIPEGLLAPAPVAEQVRAVGPRDITTEVHALLDLDPGLSMIAAIQRLVGSEPFRSDQLGDPPPLTFIPPGPASPPRPGGPLERSIR